MLSDEKCAILEKALTEDVEPRKVAAYLCLHMGLSGSEASAIRLGDCDLEQRTITIRNGLIRIAGAHGASDEAFTIQPAELERTLPIPEHVYSFLSKYLHLYPEDDCYLVSGGTEQPKVHYLQNVLFSINGKYKLTRKLSVNTLKEIFIHRCFQCSIDIYTVSEILGLKKIDTIQRKYAEYIPYNPEKLELLGRYTPGYQPPVLPCDGPRRMNLLILGAGSQGPVVKEIAQAIGMFNEIAFLDDDPNNPLARGPLADFTRLSAIYPIAIPSFGDPELRTVWFNRLRDEAGYIIPNLIHPSATISPSNVKLGDGVVIEPKVIVSNMVTIGDNVIISAGAVLDKECVISANTHIGCSCTITKGSVVPPFSRVSAGTIFTSK